jgi:hypothetical protein
MAHADPKALEPYVALLRQLREIKGLKEMRAGIIYLRGNAFLHFHADQGSVQADLKKAGGSGFDRYPLATPSDQRKLVDDAKRRASRADED